MIYGIDPGVLAHTRLAIAAGWRGEIDEMDRRFDAARRIERDLGHAFSSSFLYTQTAATYHWLRDTERAREDAERALGIAIDNGFAFYTAAIKILRGNLRVKDDGDADGLLEIEEGLGMIDSVRSHLLYPYFISLHAEAYGGDPEHGLAMLPDAIAVMEKTRTRYVEAQLYCVKGHLLREAKLYEEAERAYAHAIATAQTQGLLAHQLKATLAIAELHEARETRNSTHGTLRELCTRLGSETGFADLRDARRLVDAIT